MAVIVGQRALVINLEGRHELHGAIVYVECVLHEAYDPDLSIYGVVGGDGSFEYQLEGIYLLPLDDHDDHTIESYTHWQNY